MDTGIDAIMQRKAAKKEEKKDKEPFENELIIETTPTGLYYARYLKGPVPDVLKGTFTRVQSILSIAKQRNIPVKGY